MKSLMALKTQVKYVNMPMQYEPRYEKTGLRDFRPGPTQTRL